MLKSIFSSVTSCVGYIEKNDLARSLFFGALSPVIPIINETLKSGSLTFDWKAMGVAAISGIGISLSHSFLTQPETPKPDATK